ncbi:MAG: NAD(P)H-hydrate dehydratase [Peptococcaceae bacterium]|nr:NAD(P)H-hydrate dehydratase [Peptococcaceae bacterium]
MYLVTAEQMRQVDRMTIHELGIPEMVLMENAGKAVVDFLKEQFDDLQQKTITVVAGAGNNGGDALVAARYLHKLGVQVKVFIHAERELSPSAKQNYDILSRLPVKLYWLDSENSMHLLKVTVNYSDILIDGLLGTGVNRDVAGRAEQIIDIANRRSCVKVAIDVPSGLNSDSGEIWGRCLKADYTVALAQPKRGHMLNKGIKYCGQVVVKDIGIPEEIYEKLHLNCQIVDDSFLKACTEPRNRTSHKGTFGHLLTVGGSMGMSGAVTLASQAAFRTGVGLVSCAVPEAVQLHVAVNVPEAMVQPLPGGNQFGLESIEPLQELLRGKKAVVAGPGMGTGEAVGTMIGEILQTSRCPVVIDADGLNTADVWMEQLEEAKGPVILTPHPGEMARLTGLETSYIQNHRLAVAQEFAEKNKVWLVLKGANTIVAAPDGRLYMNLTDSPALAVAGSGDVLAGMIGALLAQGMPPSDACCCAVYLHGLAGRHVAETIGEVSSKASDIIHSIPIVLKG